MARKEKTKHQSFESKIDKNKFTKICNDMMDSPAWKALSRSQRYLYIELKRKYTTKYADGRLVSDNANDISIPKSEAAELYGDLRIFRTDIDSLIECGFISLIASGWTTRTVNIYGFSDRWKQYGRPDYKLPAQFERPTRRRSRISTGKTSL